MSQISSGNSSHFVEYVPDLGVCRIRERISLEVDEEIVVRLQSLKVYFFDVSVTLQPLFDGWNNRNVGCLAALLSGS